MRNCIICTDGSTTTYTNHHVNYEHSILRESFAMFKSHHVSKWKVGQQNGKTFFLLGSESFTFWEIMKRILEEKEHPFSCSCIHMIPNFRHNFVLFRFSINVLAKKCKFNGIGIVGTRNQPNTKCFDFWYEAVLARCGILENPQF